MMLSSCASREAEPSELKVGCSRLSLTAGARSQSARQHPGLDLLGLALPWILTLLKLTWLVLGEDQAARSHRVEQLTAL